MESSTASPSNEPTLKFKGVWIPYEIWEGNAATDPVRALTWVEKILWSIISAYGKKGDPCYASNEWLADRLGTTAARVANAISVLRKSGFITDDGFDGRRKFRLAVIPSEPVKKPVESAAEVKAALTQELMQPKRQGYSSLNAGVNPEPSPNKEEYKGERKEKEEPVQLQAGSVKARTAKSFPPEADRWNQVCGDLLGRVIGWSKKRADNLATRRKDVFWSMNYETALSKITNSTFCCGVNDRGWKASLDWLLERQDALLKVIEGKYDNRNGHAVNGERRKCF